MDGDGERRAWWLFLVGGRGFRRLMGWEGMVIGIEAEMVDLARIAGLTKRSRCARGVYLVLLEVPQGLLFQH